ncbi:hypothetical protein BT69DRAFT_993957, partial [Atractiella rhizophila]
HQWANDAKAASDFVYGRFRGEELVWLGHSNGGNVFTILPAIYWSRFSRALFVSCWNPSCRFMSARHDPTTSLPPETLEEATARVGGILDWCRALGYLPGPELTVGEEMTLGVAEDWWGGMLTEDYIWSKAGLPDAISGYSVPTMTVVYTDDTFLGSIEPIRKGQMPHLPFARMYGRYVNPEKMGWGEVGHMNSFRKKGRGRTGEGGLWEFYRMWLAEGKIRERVAEVEWYHGPPEIKPKL